MSYGEDVKETAKFTSLGVVAYTVAVIGIYTVGYAVYRTFAPLDEQVRYNTFKESQSYNDKVAQDLAEMQSHYSTDNPEQQVALQSLVKQRYAGYDADRLPAGLKQFLTSLRGY